jgi:hypothetical protein
MIIFGDPAEPNELGGVHYTRGGGGVEKRNAYRILVRKPEGKGPTES